MRLSGHNPSESQGTSVKIHTLLFKNSFIEILFTYHTIPPFKIYISMIFCICTGKYTHHRLILAHFHHLMKKPTPFSYPLHPYPTPTVPKQPSCSAPSVCMHFSALGLSYTWHHATCSLLCGIVLSRSIHGVQCVPTFLLLVAAACCTTFC